MAKNEFSILDKDSIRDRTLCTNCNRLLNVGPIYCYGDVSSIQEICGRCSYTLNNVSSKFRQYTFEKLAEHLTYPCSHKNLGCNTVLKWNEVMNHEMVCTYQLVSCPLSHKDLCHINNCDWAGNVKDLNEHIETCHKDLMLSNPQVSLKGHNMIYFTRVGLHLITIVVKFEYTVDDEQLEDTESNEEFEPTDPYKCYCLLMINGNDIESQCFRYQLELYGEDKENSLILRKNRLEPLGCMEENFKNMGKMLEVDLNNVKGMLKSDGIIMARFGVVKKHKKEISQITGNKESEIFNGQLSSPATKEKVVSPDENMLQELECPVCNEFMIPPIFICHAGKK